LRIDRYLFGYFMGKQNRPHKQIYAELQRTTLKKRIFPKTELLAEQKFNQKATPSADTEIKTGQLVYWKLTNRKTAIDSN